MEKQNDIATLANDFITSAITKKSIDTFFKTLVKQLKRINKIKKIKYTSYNETNHTVLLDFEAEDIKFNVCYNLKYGSNCWNISDSKNNKVENQSIIYLITLMEYLRRKYGYKQNMK